MGEFIRFYSWGLSMKFHMAVYTLALVFFKAIFNALAGGWIEAFGWHAVFRILASIQALVMIPILFLVLRVSPQEVGLQPLGSGPVASEGGSAPV